MNYIKTRFVYKEILYPYLLIVIFSQLLQLLALVMLNAVQHQINLTCFILCFIIFITQTAAIHANQTNDIKTNETLSYNLEDQCQHQEPNSTDGTSDKTVYFHTVKITWIDEESAEGEK